MNYNELSALLAPEQFSQLESVRAHLLQDPTVMDKQKPGQENADGAKEEGK